MFEMKGVVFTQFPHVVAQTWAVEMTDDIVHPHVSDPDVELTIGLQQ